MSYLDVRCSRSVVGGPTDGFTPSATTTGTPPPGLIGWDDDGLLAAALRVLSKVRQVTH